MDNKTIVKNILDDFFVKNLNEGDIYTLEATPSEIDEFETDASKGEIFFALKPENLSDTTLREFVNGLGITFYPGHFVFSILHEVGHVFTIDDFDPFYYEDDDPEYAKHLQNCLDRKKELSPDSVKDLKEYFALPDELAATEWAVNYCNDPDNLDKLNQLRSDLKNYIDASMI